MQAEGGCNGVQIREHNDVRYHIVNSLPRSTSTQIRVQREQPGGETCALKSQAANQFAAEAIETKVSGLDDTSPALKEVGLWRRWRRGSYASGVLEPVKIVIMSRWPCVSNMITAACRVAFSPPSLSGAIAATTARYLKGPLRFSTSKLHHLPPLDSTMNYVINPSGRAEAGYSFTSGLIPLLLPVRQPPSPRSRSLFPPQRACCKLIDLRIRFIHFLIFLKKKISDIPSAVLQGMDPRAQRTKLRSDQIFTRFM